MKIVLGVLLCLSFSCGGPGHTKIIDIEAEDGVNGEVGEDGATGEVGPKGEVGIEGPIGAQGKNGLDGSAGLRGPSGLDGTNGSTGPQGPMGPQGRVGSVDSRVVVICVFRETVADDGTADGVWEMVEIDLEDFVFDYLYMEQKYYRGPCE